MKIACKGSKNKSINQINFKIMAKKSILTSKIYNDLLNLGKEEIERYVQHFPNELDYNIVQFGNLLIYYDDIRELLEYAEYKTNRYTNEQIWNYYKSVVHEVVNKYFL